jgi:hypothetical protein
MELLKKDVGTWDCVVKFYTDPSADPMTSKAVETNTMVGDYWVIGDFKGEIAGAPFHGSSQMGYDTATKKFLGTWVDSMSPMPTRMEGTWDEKTKTMTFLGTSKDPTGAENKSKIVVVYQDAEHHTMSMYMHGGGADWTKTMEVAYTRKK